MLEPVIASNLAGLRGIAHGFFTRRGGASTGIYEGLNCGLGSQDVADAVLENRLRVGRHLGASSVLTAHQVHSPTAVVVDAPWQPGDRPKADAIVTATPGIAVGVLSADCAPVLFAAPAAGVVAAAHASVHGFEGVGVMPFPVRPASLQRTPVGAALSAVCWNPPSTRC